MPPDTSQHAQLLAHGGVAPAAVSGLTVLVQQSAGALELQFVLAADLTRIALPERAADPSRCDGLWSHTCFEAFMGAMPVRAYREFNFSPSGHWAAYDFAAYRSGIGNALLTQPPDTRWRVSSGCLELRVRVPSADLIARNPGTRHGSLRLGLAAVIESEGGRLSYWALRHPGMRPDFHHPESFLIELQP